MKALAISTALTGMIGAVALAGLKYGGLGAKDIADVASWHGAMQAGQYHRVRPALLLDIRACKDRGFLCFSGVRSSVALKRHRRS